MNISVQVLLSPYKVKKKLLLFLLPTILTKIFFSEGNGRDTSAVISSLVQLMLDKDFRSICGFQSLIQKEWISLGHPFSTRLGLIRDIGNEQSPVFLLFLDCVWQLQNQFPTAFEFSETYLTTVFDSCHTSFFDTFIFDCERDRLNAIVSKIISKTKKYFRISRKMKICCCEAYGTGKGNSQMRTLPASRTLYTNWMIF